MKSLISGYILAFFTVMMWSLNLIYAKYLAGVVTPAEISFYRWLFALIVMLPFCYKNFKAEFKAILAHWKLLVLMAATGTGGLNLLVYYAGYTATATNMSLISILGPIFLIFMSAQKISASQITGIIITVFGVMMIILNGNFKSLSEFKFVDGDIYMLGSAFLFAVYAVLQKRIPANVHTISMLFATIILCTLAFLPPVIGEFTISQAEGWSYKVWGVLLALGVVNSFLAYLFWNIAIQKIGTIAAGALYYTMPIFTMFFSFIFLHEKADFVQLIGILIIFAGIIPILLPSLKHKAELNS
jgi:drug/metabolite transporter (DMT)-like permease